MLKHAIYVALAALLAAFTLSWHISRAQAGEPTLKPIIRPFHSLRSMTMGGVHLTTGLYEENFYGNPARVTANPKWKIQILDLTGESKLSSIKSIGPILGGGASLLKTISSTAGDVLFARAQLGLLSFYIPGETMSWGFGIQSGTVAYIALRKTFEVEYIDVTDASASLSVGRLFLDKKLSVGLTAHAGYRLSVQEGLGLADLIENPDKINPLENAGDGIGIDASLGGTYQLPWRFWDFDFTTALAFNQLLGGKYDLIDINLSSSFKGKAPRAQPRTMGLGVAATRATAWKFTDLVVALEFTDIGNNPDGSWFKWVHIGSEAKFGILRIRLGFNQGYPGVGLGLDAKVVQLDLGTYGEELALSTGQLQNRVLALRFGLSI